MITTRKLIVKLCEEVIEYLDGTVPYDQALRILNLAKRIKKRMMPKKRKKVKSFARLKK